MAIIYLRVHHRPKILAALLFGIKEPAKTRYINVITFFISLSMDVLKFFARASDVFFADSTYTIINGRFFITVIRNIF